MNLARVSVSVSSLTNIIEKNQISFYFPPFVKILISEFWTSSVDSETETCKCYFIVL